MKGGNLGVLRGVVCSHATNYGGLGGMDRVDTRGEGEDSGRCELGTMEGLAGYVALEGLRMAEVDSEVTPLP